MEANEENKRLALHYKEKGNEEFSRGNLEEAIKFYSRAIECDDRNEVFYSNRSAVYLKMNLCQTKLVVPPYCRLTSIPRLFVFQAPLVKSGT